MLRWFIHKERMKQDQLIKKIIESDVKSEIKMSYF